MSTNEPTHAPQGASSTAGDAVNPFCMHLQSKKILKRACAIRSPEDVFDASNHCWCGVTGKILGPDRFQAHPEDCTQDRSCHESPLSGLL